MIITPLFSEMKKPVVVSEKFGLEFTNLSKEDEDTSYIKLKIINELEQYKKDNINVPLRYRSEKTLADIMSSEYYFDCFINGVCQDENKCVDAILEKTLALYSIESPNSMLALKNEFSVNPINEISLEEKFVRLLSFLENYKSLNVKCANINIAYNDKEYRQLNSNIHLIGEMYWRVAPHALGENNPYRFYNHNEEYEYKVNAAIQLGCLIDRYIESEQDFFIIDYVMDVISSNEDIGAFGIVKMLSLIEMLIVKPNYTSLRQEFRTKMPQFLPENILDKDLWIKSMYGIRSKIAHGDYLGIISKTSKYANDFMENYEFDFYESHKQNLIYSHINGVLFNVVANIVRTMLTLKTFIVKIKYS